MTRLALKTKNKQYRSKRTKVIIKTHLQYLFYQIFKNLNNGKSSAFCFLEGKKKDYKKKKNSSVSTSVHKTPCQVVHCVKIIRLKHLGKKAMKQQGTWLVYCLSFVYEAVFKFNYYSKLNSNWHQETSLYMTKLKKKSRNPNSGFSSKLIHIGRNYSKLTAIIESF